MYTCVHQQEFVLGYSTQYNFNQTGFQYTNNGITNFVDGIKAAGEFIVNTVLTALIDMTIFVIKNIIDGLVEVVKNLLPTLPISKTPSGYKIGSVAIDIFREGLELKLRVDRMTLNFGTFYFGAPIDVETLGIENPNWLILGLSALQTVSIPLIMVLDATGRKDASNTAMIASLVLFSLGILLNSYVVLSNNSLDKQTRKDFSKGLGLFLIFGIIIPDIFIFGTNSKNPRHKGRTISENIKSIGFPATFLGTLFRNLNAAYSSIWVSLGFALWDFFNSIILDSEKNLEKRFEEIIILILNLVIVSSTFLPAINRAIQKSTEIPGSKFGSLRGMNKVHQYVKFQLIISFILILVLTLMESWLIK